MNEPVTAETRLQALAKACEENVQKIRAGESVTAR